MPLPYVKDLAKKLGKSDKEIEKLWDKAKAITSDTFGIPESKFTNKEYAYTIGVVKNMLNINDSVKSTDFLTFDDEADKFIETVVSSQFNIGTVVDKRKDKKDDKEKKDKVIVSKATNKVKSCPICSKKYLIATGYCPSCGKKVAKPDPDDKNDKKKDAVDKYGDTIEE